MRCSIDAASLPRRALFPSYHSDNDYHLVQVVPKGGKKEPAIRMTRAP